ncbi:MAG: O-methyltransferase [Bdellovibrionales bacterium]|nr:O-methyltransferase [Bdellovibrionales bacterium]
MRQGNDQSYKYIESVFHPDSEKWLNIRRAMAETQKEGMSLSPVEAGFLQFLIRTQGIKNIIEIGCFLGYSALKMAEALPADGKLTTIEFDPTFFAITKNHVKNFNMEEKVQVLHGDAMQVLKTLQGPFDLCFIDADKGGYLDYLDWAEKNVRKDGWIIGDNTFLFGAVFSDEKPAGESTKRWQTMRIFNERLSDPKKYLTTCIPFNEGMTIAKKLF